MDFKFLKYYFKVTLNVAEECHERSSFMIKLSDFKEENRNI